MAGTVQSLFRHQPECPFCGQSGPALFDVRYSETAEANPSVGDVAAQMLSCTDCGIAYPSVAFDHRLFTELYAKSLDDLTFFDDSILQRMRRLGLSFFVWWQRGDPLYSALQVPLIDRPLRAARILDVGCGFGEFAAVYQSRGAAVTATEVIPQLVERTNRLGVDCRLGVLEELALPAASFDIILFRAVLYRTQRPADTISEAKRLLAPGGIVSIVYPCVDLPGLRYFAGKQFPQGRYYIMDATAFGRMLHEKFGLRLTQPRAIYGRPGAPLKKVRMLGNIVGLGELMWNNATRRKPYMLSYLLSGG
jgi:SAM-dependent methyltransferase